jgi:hypothetical protein
VDFSRSGSEQKTKRFGGGAHGRRRFGFYIDAIGFDKAFFGGL